MPKRRTIGIDFGTSTTLVAIRETTSASDRFTPPDTIPIGSTLRWIPSEVGIAVDGRLLVGEEAVGVSADRRLRSVKSLITGGEGATADVLGSGIGVADVVRLILSQAVSRTVERAARRSFDRASVKLGCPALWTGVERRILVDAARCVGDDIGLDSLASVDIGDVIDEPVAAGLSWIHRRWLERDDPPNGHVLVFDAGGGTLDVALLNVVDDGTGRPQITVLAAEGMAESGDKIDSVIVEDLRGEIAGLPDEDLASALLTLRARDLKEALSRKSKETLALGGEFRVRLTYTRDQLEKCLAPQLARWQRLVLSVLRSARTREAQTLSPEQIRRLTVGQLTDEVRHVVLVGGVSNIPAISAYLENLFPAAAVVVDPNPQEAVVAGLCWADDVFQLNLPRPPFSFVLDYFTSNGDLLPRQFESWQRDNRILYRAFDPLYPWWQIPTRSILGLWRQLPYPRGYSGRLKVRISCVAPDRDRTPVGFRFDDGRIEPYLEILTDEPINTTTRNGSFSLGTDGRIVVHGCESKLSLRVKEWTPLIGPHHNFLLDVTDEGSDCRYAPQTEPHYE